MTLHDFVWLYVTKHDHDSALLCMSVHVSVQLCMTLHYSAWLLIISHYFVWLCMTQPNSAWLCVTPCNSWESSWLCMTSHDTEWLHMTLHDSAWLHVTLYDAVWLCMTLNFRPVFNRNSCGTPWTVGSCRRLLALSFYKSSYTLMLNKKSWRDKLDIRVMSSETWKPKEKNSKIEFKIFFKGSRFQSVFFKANLFQILFSQKNAHFWQKDFQNLGGRGGGGLVMKHEGPLGLYKPKTFSYWDLNIFDYLFQNQSFSKSLFSQKLPFLKQTTTKSHGGGMREGWW
jgi:hypothetical protein